MNKKIIFLIILIIIILILFFFSQQAYSNKIVGVLGANLSSGANWLTSKMYAQLGEDIKKMSHGVRGGGGAVKNSIENLRDTIEQTKQNISENTSENIQKIENYFSGISNSILGKNSNGCATEQ